ncbi:MAG: division/cell wall cluster transcriptional repressor MraZ [Candidatus Magnetobacterium sp. LHC-1]|nr:division/cell wall cluster transcriptional repressor MraZ [Nitrospirota bacterium]
MAGFYGRHILKVDDKGRLVIPAQFRDVIKDNYGRRIFITCTVNDECLQVFPDKEWEALMNKVAALPRSSDAVKYFMRKVVGSACESEFDRHGRVVIPPILREEVGIMTDTEVVLTGVSDRLEVWQRQRWEKMFRPGDADVRQYEAELAKLGI